MLRTKRQKKIKRFVSVLILVVFFAALTTCIIVVLTHNAYVSRVKFNRFLRVASALQATFLILIGALCFYCHYLLKRSSAVPLSPSLWYEPTLQNLFSALAIQCLLESLILSVYTRIRVQEQAA